MSDKYNNDSSDNERRLDKETFMKLLTPESLLEFSRETAKHFKIPDLISEFIISYLQDIHLKNLLSIWIGYKEFEKILTPIINHFKPKKVIALDESLHFSNYEYYPPIKKVTSLDRRSIIDYDIDSEDFERFMDDFTEYMYSKIAKFSKIDGVPIDWRISDIGITDLLDAIEDSFDLILGFEPFLRSFSLEKEIKEGIDKLILTASKLLTSKGICIFLIESKIFEQFQDLFGDLEGLGLYIKAFLLIPSRILSSFIFKSRALIIIQKEKIEKLFVGELTSIPKSKEILLRNLKAHQYGRMPQLGTLVEPHSFQNFQTLLFEREIETLIQRHHFMKYLISEIALEINDAKNEDTIGFSEKANAIFVPLFGDWSVENSVTTLKDNYQNYVQIVLNPERVDSIFVSNYLNSSIGIKILKLWLSGKGGFRGIPKEDFLRFPIYLPDLSTQMKIVDLDSRINTISKQLKNLKLDLWNTPVEYKKIENIINELDYDKSFEVSIKIWMEKIPFPLASILRLYISDINIEHKIDHLFHFFEALSEFTVMVILSVFSNDESFYEHECRKWIEKDPKYQDWVKIPTFGAWNLLGRKLSKVIRTYLNDRDKINVYLEIFRLPEEFLKMIADKKLYSTLEKIAEWRNLWKGHGGVASRKELENRLLNLQISLFEIQKIVGNHYQDVILIKAGPMKFSEGIFHHEVITIVGPTTPFIIEKIDSLEPMDERKLYIMHKEFKRPILIKFPFILIMESQGENACYFFNRIEEEGVRYISYHFESEPEKTVPHEEFEEVLSLLRLKK